MAVRLAGFLYNPNVFNKSDRRLGAMGEQRSSLYARTAQMAANALDGHFGLAAYLNVRPDVVLAWMAGTLAVAEPYFLQMVDIVTDELTPAQRRAIAAARRVGKQAAQDEVFQSLPSTSAPDSISGH